MGEPIKFLFTMWDGGGTVPPELGVAKRLVARGHSVRVLADPVIEDEARAAGCAFSPWTTAPHRTTRDRSGDIIRDYDAGSPLKMMATYMKLFLAEPAPRWAADTLAELEARPVDVFVTDQMLPATNIAAEKLGLPRAAISPQIWMLPTPGLPPLGTGLRPAGGPLGRMREAGIRFYTDSMRMTGSGGCNQIASTYARDGDQLSFGPIRATRMACADAALNRQEADFLAALQATRRYEILRDTLILAREGERLARLAPPR